jgi:hypothetical protein
MHPVNVGALLAFAQGLVGQQLHTLHQGCPFKIPEVDIPNAGLEGWAAWWCGPGTPNRTGPVMFAQARGGC